MTSYIAIVVTIAIVILLVSLSKKRRNEKPSAFVCEQCSEQDCICHETDEGGNGRK